MSRRTKLALGGVGLLAVMLTLLEVALRVVGLGDPPVAILDDEIEYYPQPGGTFHRFGNEITVNRYGMRSPDFEQGDVAGRGVFLLGDSVVYGNHFLDQRETVAARLQERLGQGASPVAAIAASSWGPGNLLAFWERFGPFRGEVAIVVQSAHDRADVPFTTTDIIPYRTRASVCALDDALQVVWERSKRALSDGEGARVTLSFEEQRAAAERSLRALIQTLKPHFTRVVLMYHPTLAELRGQQPGEASHFRQLAAELGVGWATAFDAALPERELERLFNDDIHPSAAGTQFIAAYLQGVITSSPAPRVDAGSPSPAPDGG